jgi:ABC-type multidrug transport system fused ATPase/permease subunit
LTGSLRENLDPFSQYDDATLNSALRASGLFSLQADDEDGRLTLDSQISSGGNNVSVGQRQILALARAIVRGSKLLILDEGACFRLPSSVSALVDPSCRLQQRPLLVNTFCPPCGGYTDVSRGADYKTDTIIQTSLRNELKGDVTLITVAHRLQTIIDADKVVSYSPSPYSVKSCLRRKK